MMRLPFDYSLDESDPDIVILRRRDGCFVAAFSASGATREGIRKAAMEDYRILLEAYAISPALQSDLTHMASCATCAFSRRALSD
jgi:hypothetical protein